jgi:AraC-like DNA-binding protein
MKVINLPQDIFQGNEIFTDHIIIHDYTVKEGAFKGKSILHTNAISMVISGEKTILFAEKTIRVTDDTFHFLSAGNCLASVSLPGGRDFRSILIFFDNKMLSDFYIKHNALIEGIKKNKSVCPESYISFPKDPFIYNFIASLDLLIQSGGFISKEMKWLKFEELMLHLFEKHPQTILSFPLAKKNAFDDMEIRKAVETNIANNISLEELAFLCNTSLSTFKRRFTSIYGTSPNKWILQKRMELARDLLMHKNERPGEVYRKVGYENHSSFSQSFKKIYGLSPKDFQAEK